MSKIIFDTFPSKKHFKKQLKHNKKKQGEVGATIKNKTFEDMTARESRAANLFRSCLFLHFKNAFEKN
jgi:hypothetical protein